MRPTRQTSRSTKPPRPAGALPLPASGAKPAQRLSPPSSPPACKNPSSSSAAGQKGSGQRGNEQKAGSSARRLTMVGMWAAMLNCLSNMAVSLEGDINRRVDVDGHLRRHEKTSYPPAPSGVTRYDFAHVGSNEPAEDEHQELVAPVPSGYWSFFGLFDGHNGGDTSKWLAENLIPAVCGALADLYSSLVDADSSTIPNPVSTSITQTLKDTFTRLDDDIMHTPLKTIFASSSRRPGEAELLAPAYAGSCGLLAWYDSHSQMLRVACTGDSRAVLGRRRINDEGEVRYDVYILSMEQNGINNEERARIESQHPGEDLIHNGRIFGMAVTRAFGDARYKWSRDTQDKLRRRGLNRACLPEVKTPPYITAEPEVTAVEIQPGDFLIMATDGLWESLTSEEAVGLVGVWRESQKIGYGSREPVGGYAPDNLPVWMAEKDDTLRYRQWGAEKRFVRRDANVATHLLRNALGGADRDLTSALLSMRTPKARNYRDDMTVIVVSFADEEAGSPNLPLRSA